MTANSRRVRIAIAHDYITQRGGAERVVLSMAKAFPGSPIFTTLFEPDQTFPEFQTQDVRSTGLNRVGHFRRNHRHALPILPIVSSSLHVDADIVIASSSGWSHGFPTTGLKLVYCYSPPRWLYQPDRYLGERGSPLLRGALRIASPWMKRWDRRAAASADKYLAISTVVSDRIRATYGLTSKVLPAPHSGMNAPSTEVEDLPPAGYFLVVSRLLPYKNVDAVVQAFAQRPEFRLVVVGSGPQKEYLRAAAGRNVHFMENLTDSQMTTVYSGARALIAASYEDYGLTPLEAGVHGIPSAVLRWGGFLDTMVEGVTAVYFDRPIPSEIVGALDALVRRDWDTDAIRWNAARYSENRFIESLRAEVDSLLGREGRSASPAFE